MGRPVDLINPLLPDPDDLHAHRREDGTYEWPEAGPSRIVDGNPTGITKTKKNVEEASVGPYSAKIVAAMTGAIATSLTMTPFDVLKTRLQTVQPHPRLSFLPPAPSSECCQTSLLVTSTSSSSSSASSSSLSCATTTTSTDPVRPPRPQLPRYIPPATTTPDGCLHPSKWAGIWGETVTFEQAIARGTGVGHGVGGAGAGGATLVLPSESVLGGFWNEVAAVRRETGVKGLWKGVGTTLTMSIPSAAIYMLGYERLLSHISPIFTGTYDAASNASALNRPTTAAQGGGTTMTPAPLVAGSLARTLSASVISPIEMFRTRLQALPTERGNPTYASTAKDMGRLVKNNGLTVMWRGLGPTLWRDVPFSGLYWAGFELLKPQLAPHFQPLLTSFLSGAISGTISAVLTQPFDVLKTRRQVFTPSADCTTPRASTIPLLFHVAETEGWSSLFAGLGARCGKVAMACGVMIACYEGVGRWLGGQDDEE